MNETIGKVIEVFIPNEYIRGNLLDVMDCTHIGFRVMTDEGIKDVIVETNEFNTKIMKDDLVVIREQIISDKYYVDIELCEGEYYE